MKALVLYLPVLHRGYLDFLSQHQGLEVYILSDELRHQFRPLQKDLRALSAEEAQQFVMSLHWFPEVRILGPENIANLDKKAQLIMPDEDELHALAEDFFAEYTVSFEPTFLRWDRTKTTAEQTTDHLPSTNEPIHQEWMKKAEELAKTSQDWWRQVAALVVKDDQLLFQAVNRHVPDNQQPLYDGDPRANFSQGQHIELSTAFHAEAQCVAEAAKDGVSLAGTAIYVTTFPCPPCAKLIAYSGITELYFKEGYALGDGLDVLESQGVTMERVEMDEEA